MKLPPAAGPVIRVAIAVLLCAACFQAGRWYQELSAPVPPEMVAAISTAPAADISEPAPLIAAGRPAGEDEAIITPLNVRDPSALVMGPSTSAPPDGATPPPAAPPPALPKGEDAEMEAKLRALSQERLLEILRKAKKNDAPKDF